MLKQAALYHSYQYIRSKKALDGLFSVIVGLLKPKNELVLVRENH